MIFNDPIERLHKCFTLMEIVERNGLKPSQDFNLEIKNPVNFFGWNVWTLNLITQPKFLSERIIRRDYKTLGTGLIMSLSSWKWILYLSRLTYRWETSQYKEGKILNILFSRYFVTIPVISISLAVVCLSVFLMLEFQVRKKYIFRSSL